MPLIIAVVLFSFMMAVSSYAASTLSITQPKNGDYISKSSPPSLKWTSVSGAAGYRITVKNDATGEYYKQNYWTTKKSYSLSNITDDLSSNEFPRLKIWVGAMAAKSDDPALGCLADQIIFVTVADVPTLGTQSSSNITTNGATLKMTISNQCGSDITDSGFYIGTSSTKSRMTKYSFQDYGSYSASAIGTKTMTITTLEPDTKYYYRAYAVNAMGEEYLSAKNFTTDEDTSSKKLSLSKTSLSFAWNDTASSSVTVTYSGSYSYSVAYSGISSSDKATFDYEWLTVTKSGSTLKIVPERNNYSASKRTATVTVTSNGLSKDITVSQDACGESAPTITLWRGTSSNKTIYKDGDSIGSYSLPQTNMEISITSNHVRKVTANLSPVSGGSTIDSSTSTSLISLDISGCTAGTYKITFYASNSDTPNDYWKQSPFSSGSMVLYFTLTENSSSSGGNENDKPDTISTLEHAKSIVMYSKNNQEVSVKKEFVRHMPQITGYANFCDSYWKNDYFDLTTSYNENNNNISKPYCHELCSRAAYSMALSYLGIDLTPVEMSTIISSRGISGSYGNSNPYKDITDKISNVKHIEGSLDNLYDNYASNKNYSPIYFHFSKPHCILIIGQKSEDVYYVVDPSVRSNLNAAMYNEHIYEMTLDKTNKKIKSFSYNGTKIFTSWEEYSYSYVHQWYINENCSHTHLWSEWVTEGNSQTRYCYLCDVVSKQNLPSAGVTKYTVSYDDGDGTGAPASVTVNSGETINISTTTPTLSGYTFQGWATVSGSSAASYQPGDSYKVTGSVTFYAVWKKNSSGGSSGGTATYTLSGKVTTNNPKVTTTIQLLQNKTVKYSTTISSTSSSARYTQSFTISGIASGTYTLKITKPDHEVYSKTITINANKTLSAIKIYLIHDIDIDGDVDMDDVSTLIETMAEDYKPSYFDLNGDSSVDVLDALYLAKQIQ